MSKAKSLDDVRDQLYWAFNKSKTRVKKCDDYDEEGLYLQAMAQTAEALVKVEEALERRAGRKKGPYITHNKQS